MIAKVKNIDQTLFVEVIESEFATGDYIVHIGENTVFFDKNGKKIQKNDIKINSTIKIVYTNQVTLSLPPQIIATSIIILD